MDNNYYIDTLNSLIEAKKEKKKKEPTVKEREAFHNAWLSLASDGGFAGRAEQFLYEGFAFCGAAPFYDYLCKTEDPNTTLAMLFSGKYYGNDNNVTFRLVTHLLTMMLNDSAPQNVLAPVIKRFPGACLNREKKRLGTAEKSMEKYFFAELHSDIVLCPLSDISTKPVFIKDFVVLVSSIIDGIESNGSAKGTVAKNIAKVRKWFSDYEALQETISAVPAAVIGVASATAEKYITDVYQENVETQHVPSIQPTEDISRNMTAHLVDLLDKASKGAADVKAQGMQQMIKSDELNQMLECERKKLQCANQQITGQQATISELKKRLSEVEGNIFALQQDMVRRDAVIAEKNAEIEEKSKMADVLIRDRRKQADETLQRLASKIRVEYRDFVDALGVPMSCDLGENLKLQLQSVFDILEKGGMKIK